MKLLAEDQSEALHSKQLKSFMKLLPKAKGLGEVISAALLSLLIKAAAFKELYKLLKHEAADKSSVQHSLYQGQMKLKKEFHLVVPYDPLRQLYLPRKFSLCKHYDKGK